MSVGMEINSLNWLNRSKIWQWSITYASQKFLVKQIGVSVKRFSQIFFFAVGKCSNISLIILEKLIKL